MAIEHRDTTALSPRIALASIAGFWTFYLIVWSLRSVVLYHHHQASMLGTRAIVSLGSAGATVLFYLALRRMPTARLARTITLAVLLAVPAALFYAAFNWYMFDHRGEGEPVEWNWSAPATHLALSRKPLPAPAAPAALPVSVGTMPNGPDMTMLQSIADQAGNGYFFFIAWASLYLALGYAEKIGTLERRTAALHAAAQSAELRALRYQVNPHFLFNTLNSLSSLVLADKREAAERMIMNLATFFRTSLTGDPTEDVPLSEELMLQGLYLDIERVRFPERLIARFDVPQALLDACIPGLILQPLVENAVRYAVSRSNRAVTIRVLACAVPAGLSLVIEDDGDAVAAGPPQAGLAWAFAMCAIVSPRGLAMPHPVIGGRGRKAGSGSSLRCRWSVMAADRPLRTLIVDDEPLAIERLQILCAPIPAIDLVGTAADGEAALRLIAALSPELVLLDISMPGLDGIGVARALENSGKCPAIIYCTAFDQFAVAAFDVAAVGYLLKPVAADQLARTVARVAETLRDAGAARASTPEWIEEFWVPHRSEVIRIAAADIDRIEAERDYMRLHVGQRSFLLHQTITALEQRLDQARFIRLHRSSIVRRDRIAKLRHDGLGAWYAVLADATEIRIGRSYLANARALMGRG